MSKFELKLPRMGESVAEATLTTWLKEIGDTIEMDEAVFEIATDKVDSEVPCEVDGILIEKLFNVDDIINVGDTVAIIEVNNEEASSENTVLEQQVEPEASEDVIAKVAEAVVLAKETASTAIQDYSTSERFYSPLVRNIAKQEGISISELDSIQGSGKEGRVTKTDILTYVENRGDSKPVVNIPPVQKIEQPEVPQAKQPIIEKQQVSRVAVSGGDEVIEMTRMGKLIAKHMVDSVSTSAHVQSFIEVDVTNIVNWRNKTKDSFEKTEGEKLTFTPIFLEAVAKALKKYPMMNISVDGDTVIKKKNINIGMAAARPDGNLIVPVIKNADQLNLVGMAKVVNDLANRSRNNQLKPDEVQDGTYTVTNVGTFGSVFGTPIINQPQVGI
ncbi:MAG: dihydrolipoamide acetyltransferase family protein, partial [Maribacter sp.]